MLGGKTVNILYLFSGADRPSSLAASLLEMEKIYGAKVRVEMIDIVRSEAHDLSKNEVRESFKTRIQAGEFEAVIVTPPCSTWTRVRMANQRGPRPVRDMQHPWGFPWLSNGAKQEADLGSLLVVVLIEFVLLTDLEEGHWWRCGAVDRIPAGCEGLPQGHLTEEGGLDKQVGG